MTDREKLELEFYKNGSAESVLKRFVFCEEEEKLVRDAMSTAQRTNPRMKLIRDADELLREVAKSREPISVESNSEDADKAVAIIGTMTSEYNRKQTLNKKRFFFEATKKEILYVIGMITASIGLVYYLNNIS